MQCIGIILLFLGAYTWALFRLLKDLREIRTFIEEQNREMLTFRSRIGKTRIFHTTSHTYSPESARTIKRDTEDIPLTGRMSKII